MFFSDASKLPAIPLYVTDPRGVTSGYCDSCDEYSVNLRMDRRFGMLRGYCEECIRNRKRRSF